MSRPGELYDQDREESVPVSSPPARAAPGQLYDQDLADEPSRRPVRAEPWRRHAELRQREREIELRRQERLEQERDARRQRAREAQRTPAPPAPLRISSRPALQYDSAAGTAYPRAGMRVPVVPARPKRARPSDREGSSLGGATTVLAFGTLTSRITGFVRVLTVGYVLGVGTLSDAYNYANGIPAIAYDLLLGGILSATLIPVFVEQFSKRDEAEAQRAISAVLTAISVVLAAISAVLWLLAPWVIRFYLILNPASTGPAEKALATRLLHLFAPQVFFLGTIVVTTALLNTRRRFGVAAVSPVLNNLIAIAALLATKFVAESVLSNKGGSPTSVLMRFSHDERAVLILGAGTSAGFLAQALVQLVSVRRSGYRLRPVWEPGHPAVRRVARLSTWLLGVVVANQVSLALVLVLAGKTNGGVTAYQFSYQFFQLPYALVAVSVASAIMPDLAERWTAGDRQGLERRFVTGLRLTLALLIPAGLLYAVIAQPFIDLAVHHGRVTGSGAHLVSSSLALFALGLPGFSAFFLLMRVYQAMQDARTMFWIYSVENVLTVILAVALEPAIGVPGLALAWVAPYTVASIIAAVELRSRIGRLGGVHTVRALVRVLLASAITAGLAVLVGLPFRSHSGDAALVGRLIVQLGVAGVAYAVLARLLGIKELNRLRSLMSRSLR
ncbi:MAG TPA: murein biosynthesis integral membrane protein MurJ [Acidimicrobiales bacterium]